MGKYAPLTSYLSGRPVDEVGMSFAEIEAVIGSPLPNSKLHPAWWSNNPSNNVMTKAWLAAGYRTERVDTAAERLVFRRDPQPRAGVRALEGSGDDKAPEELGFCANIHARMGGTVTIMPGVDLTEPTGEVWNAEVE